MGNEKDKEGTKTSRRRTNGLWSKTGIKNEADIENKEKNNEEDDSISIFPYPRTLLPSSFNKQTKKKRRTTNNSS